MVWYPLAFRNDAVVTIPSGAAVEYGGIAANRWTVATVNCMGSLTIRGGGLTTLASPSGPFTGAKSVVNELIVGAGELFVVGELDCTTVDLTGGTFRVGGTAITRTLDISGGTVSGGGE